jgi:Fe-S cluster assembly scaffold protein SufB
MLENRGKVKDFREIQGVAIKFLEDNYTPPQRYGTAFHITTPWQDVREMKLEEHRISNLESWENLDIDAKRRILSLDLSDVYLAWHLAHIDTVSTQLIHVAEDQSQVISLQGKGSELYWVVLERGAELTIEDCILQQELALRRMFVWQKEGSRLKFTGLRAGDNFLNERVHVELLGREASTEITHITYGARSEQADIEVSVYHKAPATHSRMMTRTAAAAKHKAIYRGLIDVDQAAKGTNGYQSGQALLLSRKAVVDQLPRLEIRTNDVRCSHGVNTTHLDDASLFYIRSRGVEEKIARELAILGFYNHKLDLPPNIRQSLEHVVKV